MDERIYYLPAGGRGKPVSGERLAKAVRVCTVPPVMAAIMLTVLRFGTSGFFLTEGGYIRALLCLCVLPLLAYPAAALQRGGDLRHRQRRNAIVFSCVGYAALLVCALAFGCTHGELVVCLSYVASIVVIAATSFVPELKASGHACSTAGPVAALSYFYSPWVLLPGLAVLAAVVWSSLKLKRHTAPQLIIGASVPAIVITLAAAIGYV